MEIVFPNLESAMRRAIELSELGLGLTAPNPIVGAVIIDEAGRLLGEGFHQRDHAGKHAEIIALENAGNKSKGATLVLSLEPCNHHGKTPPCTAAIINAGIRQVYFAVKDPNPLAQGGAETLKAAGLKVESGLLEKEAKFSNRAWLTKIEKGRPYITLKIATTLDGKVAAADGSSKWITSSASRARVAKLRSECDALATGTGTVLADNPSLTVRDVNRPGEFHPTRVVIGRSELPKQLKILDSTAPTILVPSNELSDLIEIGVAKGWNRILVEAGSKLTSAFLRAGLFDELFIYQAPTILGGSFDFTRDLGISTLSERIDLEMVSAEVISGEPDNLLIHCLAKDRFSGSN